MMILSSPSSGQAKGRDRRDNPFVARRSSRRLLAGVLSILSGVKNTDFAKRTQFLKFTKSFKSMRNTKALSHFGAKTNPFCRHSMSDVSYLHQKLAPAFHAVSFLA
jgi:hypothetical protein